MSLLYDLAFAIFAVLYFPYLLLKGRWHKDFSMRFGNFSQELKKDLQKKNNIWIHAVSVGEVLSVVNLIESIKNVFPVHQIVVSTVTKTGYALAKSTFSNDIVMYAPLDFSTTVRRYINCIKPKIYIAAETEIWPNLFLALQKNKVPIVEINGRISKDAFDGYKLIKPLIQGVLRNTQAFCMQTENYAHRIKALGAKSENVHVVGNIKFDDLPSSESVGYKDLGLKENNQLFIAGSTHAGEEEIILNIFKSLGDRFPSLHLIIAPRHIERTKEIIRLIEQSNLKAVQFSQIKNAPIDSKTVVVVDTIGDLKFLYRLATIVFVGKSLTMGGGHNIIEPAYFAKTIFIGPHTENFQDIVDMFLEEKAVIQVASKEELQEKIDDILSRPQEIKRIGLLAKSVVEKYTGATTRTMKVITKIMTDFV